MSDSKNTTEQPVHEGEPATPNEPTPKPQPPAQGDETDWKAEARKWEQRAKENKDATDRLTELEQAQMSEAEKAEARVKAAERHAAELEAANSRKDVAIKHGLTAEDATLLEGMADPEAMERLAGRLAQQARDAAGPHTPKPNPAQREGDAPVEDADAIARAFFGLKS